MHAEVITLEQRLLCLWDDKQHPHGMQVRVGRLLLRHLNCSDPCSNTTLTARPLYGMPAGSIVRHKHTPRDQMSAEAVYPSSDDSITSGAIQ